MALAFSALPNELQDLALSWLAADDMQVSRDIARACQVCKDWYKRAISAQRQICLDGIGYRLLHSRLSTSTMDLLILKAYGECGLPPVSNFLGLAELHLLTGGTLTESIVQSLDKLPNLRRLEITGRMVPHLPLLPSLHQLTSRGAIIGDIRGLSKFTSLRSLMADVGSPSAIKPSNLGDLTNLTTLDLRLIEPPSAHMSFMSTLDWLTNSMPFVTKSVFNVDTEEVPKLFELLETASPKVQALLVKSLFIAPSTWPGVVFPNSVLTLCLTSEEVSHVLKAPCLNAAHNLQVLFDAFVNPLARITSLYGFARDNGSLERVRIICTKLIEMKLISLLATSSFNLLLWACENMQIEFVTLALKYDMSPNIEDAYGITPLGYVAMNKTRFSSREVFLEFVGLLIHFSDDEPIRHLSSLSYRLTFYVDVDVLCENGADPLHPIVLATALSDPDLLLHLKELGKRRGIMLDCSFVDPDDGYTILHTRNLRCSRMAKQGLSEEALLIAIEHGLDIHAIDHTGRTAVNYSDDTADLLALLRAGFDPVRRVGKAGHFLHFLTSDTMFAVAHRDTTRKANYEATTAAILRMCHDKGLSLCDVCPETGKTPIHRIVSTMKFANLFTGFVSELTDSEVELTLELAKKAKKPVFIQILVDVGRVPNTHLL